MCDDRASRDDVLDVVSSASYKVVASDEMSSLRRLRLVTVDDAALSTLRAHLGGRFFPWWDPSLRRGPDPNDCRR
jgi:hypothetical protein